MRFLLGNIIHTKGEMAFESVSIRTAVKHELPPGIQSLTGKFPLNSSKMRMRSTASWMYSPGNIHIWNDSTGKKI